MAHAATRHVTQMDSTTSLLRALARFLHGRDFPGLGITPCYIPGRVASAVNLLPPAARSALYRWTGWLGGARPSRLGDIRGEEISQWTIDHYPPAPPAGWSGAMIGSANGAAIHLAAALGIPWLPQTFLAPVRRRLHADDLREDLEWGRAPAHTILTNNPDLCVHQMHDPVHDRHMVQRIGYFRFKRLRLGRVYEDFLHRLQPGATIYTVECNLRWPVTAVTDRHLFQVGGFGDATPQEYLQGGPRVQDFLHRYDSNRICWRVPEPTGEAPEGEWGFCPELLADVRDLARARGLRLRRILFDSPDDLSPLIADLYRWWYRQRGMDSGRLLVECFAFLEPYWALRTASVPYWLAFTAGCCARALEQYLQEGRPFDQMYLMLFSNGIEGIGMATIDRWRRILGQARQSGEFLGVNEREFPRDYASFVRYHTELKRQIRTRQPLPSPLTPAELERFLSQAGDQYAVRIVDESYPSMQKESPGTNPGA